MIDLGQSLAGAPNNSSTANARNLPAAVRDAALDPKLVTAAHQFEASLMEELLKPLTSSQIFSDDEADEGNGASAGGLGNLASAGDGSSGALMSFGSEALAKALSEKGGLGIARKVLDHFETAASEAEPQKKREGSLPRFRTDSNSLLK